MTNLALFGNIKLMSTKLKVFLLSVPLMVLFSVGVLLRSADKAVTPMVNGCYTSNLSGEFVPDLAAMFEGITVNVPREVLADSGETKVLGQASPSDRWIEVDLSEQVLRAWDGSQLFLETKISSGLPGTPTPKGDFRVWVKLRATKMEGGEGRYYYNLPNVPYVMYFENEDVPGWKGYGIHGTYWHNDFGTPHSHGCVNVPTSVAQDLYYWATPSLPSGKSSVFAGPDNPGIKVTIHD